MRTITNKLDYKLNYPLNEPYDLTDVLFFDIETTGFLASASYLYLIGAMYYEDDSWYITQWLSDDIQGEKTLLESFFNKVVSYKRLVHYNGSGFDLPYLEKKAKQFKLNSPLSSMESYDLYKKLLPFKKLLPIPNLKLKTVESFVGINREDKFSGEELIQIYANFLGKCQYEKLRAANASTSNVIAEYKDDSELRIENIKNFTSKQLQDVLLLHNKEDIEGLLKVANLLYFTDIFEKVLSPNILSSLKIDTHSLNGKIDTITIDYEIPYHFHNPITIKTPIFSSDNTKEADIHYPSLLLKLTLWKNTLTITIPVFNGELKFFPENYQDYYYLPVEDMVVHKSVAQFVDKEYRKKVKAQDCFLKKNGSFLPMPTPIYSPVYLFAYKDKISFCEIKSSLLDNKDFLVAYVESLLQYAKNSGSVCENIL